MMQHKSLRILRKLHIRCSGPVLLSVNRLEHSMDEFAASNQILSSNKNETERVMVLAVVSST